MNYKSFILMMVLGLSSYSANAAMILVDVFVGNDSDGTIDIATLLTGVDAVTELDRVDWDSTIAADQTSGALTVTGDGTIEPTSGTWTYDGTGSVDYLTVKFDGVFALFEVTDGDITGDWDTSVFGNEFQSCFGGGGGGRSSCDPYGLSHIAVYTTVVPVPAALWLFGSGLLGLIGVARRRAR